MPPLFKKHPKATELAYHLQKFFGRFFYPSVWGATTLFLSNLIVLISPTAGVTIILAWVILLVLFFLLPWFFEKNAMLWHLQSRLTNLRKIDHKSKITIINTIYDAQQIFQRIRTLRNRSARVEKDTLQKLIPFLEDSRFLIYTSDNKKTINSIIKQNREIISKIVNNSKNPYELHINESRSLIVENTDLSELKNKVNIEKKLDETFYERSTALNNVEKAKQLIFTSMPYFTLLLITTYSVNAVIPFLPTTFDIIVLIGLIVLLIVTLFLSGRGGKVGIEDLQKLKLLRQ